MTANNAPKTRKRIITIRHSTPSRRKIVIIVAQTQDALGNWLTPIITYEGPINLMIESGRYARDAGIAFIVASYVHDEFMLRVITNEIELNQQLDIGIEEDE